MTSLRQGAAFVRLVPVALSPFTQICRFPAGQSMQKSRDPQFCTVGMSACHSSAAVCLAWVHIDSHPPGQLCQVQQMTSGLSPGQAESLSPDRTKAVSSRKWKLRAANRLQNLLSVLGGTRSAPLG